MVPLLDALSGDQPKHKHDLGHAVEKRGHSIVPLNILRRIKRIARDVVVGSVKRRPCDEKCEQVKRDA